MCNAWTKTDNMILKQKAILHLISPKQKLIGANGACYNCFWSRQLGYRQYLNTSSLISEKELLHHQVLSSHNFLCSLPFLVKKCQSVLHSLLLQAKSINQHETMNEAHEQCCRVDHTASKQTRSFAFNEILIDYDIVKLDISLKNRLIDQKYAVLELGSIIILYK